MATPPTPMPNRKLFSCAVCDHYQRIEFNHGECRAHPPRYCPEEPDAVNLWPAVTPPELVWCDEYKRHTFTLPQTDNENPHNGRTCQTCDHWQPADDQEHEEKGYCMAHPPRATCTALVADREEDCFPGVDPELRAPWCSEWKRRATEEPAT